MIAGAYHCEAGVRRLDATVKRLFVKAGCIGLTPHAARLFDTIPQRNEFVPMAASV
jgi:hypothetical protein